MVSLVLLAFLENVLREIHQPRSKFWFAGILMLIFGDGFQLPVVGGQRIVSKPESMQPELQDTSTYFSENFVVFAKEKTKHFMK